MKYWAKCEKCGNKEGLSIKSLFGKEELYISVDNFKQYLRELGYTEEKINQEIEKAKQNAGN